MAESRQNIYIISIVAIVAVIAIIALIISSMNAGTSTMQSTTQNSAGQTYIAANAYGAYGYRNLACTDTDGLNYYAIGYVTGKDIFGNIYIKEPDYCRANNSSVLVEYSCQFNYVNKTEYNCQEGCKDGACKRCAPGTLLNGNDNQCISCNAKGTAYLPDDSKCPTGTHCISIISLTEVGKCLAQQMCTAPSCNGAQYCVNGQWTNCTSGQTCSSGQCTKDSASKWITGVYPNWWWGTLDPENLDWTGMTHVILYTGTGVTATYPYFSSGGLLSSGLSAAYLNRTIIAAHSHGVRILLSVANVYPGTEWNAIASDNSKIDSLVSSSVAFAKANGFDGIALDLEYPQDKVAHNYLLNKYRAALDQWNPHGLLVEDLNMYPLPGYDPIVMNADLDQMIAMTYTMWGYCQGPIAGFGTPVYQSSLFAPWKGCTLNDDTIKYISAGYDLSKFGISVSFEAVKFSGVTKVGDRYSSWGFSQARNDIRSDPTIISSWDDTAKASYYLSGNTLYDLQTPQSINAIATWAKQNNFGGIAVYDIPAGWIPNKATIPTANPLWEALTSTVNNIPYCGNGALEAGEQCDGKNLGGATCSSILGTRFSGNVACIDCKLSFCECKMN